MSDIPLILLAGGDNSRFFPLNTSTHKGCRAIAGRPLLVRAIENAIHHGFSKIILVVSQKDFDNQGISQQLQEHNLSAEIEYVLQPSAKGQADAILLAWQKLDQAESCVVGSPYYLNIGELSEQLVSATKTSTASCILLGSNTDQPEQYGILSTDGNRVTGVTEKPTQPVSNKKINSVYFFKKEFLQYLSETPSEEYSLETAINTFAASHTVEWLEVPELPSLKFPWHLLDFMKIILKEQHGFVSPSAKISEQAILDDSKGPIVIEAGATIKDFAKVSGPAYIGKDVLIGEYSYVRGSAIEKGSRVGVRTEVVRSLIENSVSIHSSYCADSIIGANSSVSVGLITANKRLDRQEIHTKVKEKKVSTKTNALGVITGENVNIGIGVNTMPGLLIGEGSTIYPGLTLFDSIPADSVIKDSTN